jgi:zinc transport system substrate-binding protein
MRLLSLLVMALLGLALSGCDRTDASPDQVHIEDVVRTTSAPVDALTRRIAGDAVQVELLCPQSEDPAAWRPDPETVASYQRAKLIVANGAGYEAWVQTAPLPRSRLIEAADGLSEPLIRVRGETHSHGPEGHHTHEVTLGQIWLDPLHAAAQARAIAAGLADAFPEHQDTFVANLDALSTEQMDLHQRLERLEQEGAAIVAPSTPFGYLARRYGWQTLDLTPAPEDWLRDLYAHGMESGDFGSGPRVLLCAQLPDPAVANSLLESHNVHLVLWRTGSRDPGMSFTDVLSGNIDRLEASIP